MVLYIQPAVSRGGMTMCHFQTFVIISPCAGDLHYEEQLKYWVPTLIQ